MSSIEYTVNSDGSITITSMPSDVENVSTDISGLITLKSGSVASSRPLNDNMVYLTALIAAVNENTNNTKTTVTEYVNNTVERTLSIYQDVVTLDTSGEIELVDNTVNKTSPDGDISFVLPTIYDEEGDKFHQIYLMLDISNEFDFDNDGIDLGAGWSFDGTSLEITESGRYNVIYEYDGEHWIGGILKRVEVE